ncbi:MAG TPA: galactokinase [Gemmatimonadales bacterium]|nr:galactokinase [Gemmatimonadales bacterium]
MRAQAIELFRATFGTVPTHAASAPARVNLIGEHTDYNGGPVMPFATPARTVAAVAAGEDGSLQLVSTRDGVVARVRWDSGVPPGWAGYAVGVMRELSRIGAAPGGAHLALASNVAVGAGLASSAALSVAMARALALLAGVQLDPRDLVGVAHRAEVEHVGVRCGIMDQSIAVRARAGTAMLLECATGAARFVPLRARVLLVDTGARHELASSAYNTRRAECDAALALLRKARAQIGALAEWPVESLRVLTRRLPQPLRSRAKHVVTETARTRQAAELLRKGRLRQLGALLFASHESCRRDYACSAPELDLVVRAARRAGAWGARMTGAGWGGNVLVLVGPPGGSAQQEALLRRRITSAFARRYGREPAVTLLTASGGARPERVT